MKRLYLYFFILILHYTVNSQIADTTKTIVSKWKLAEHFYEKGNIDLDTSINNFQIYHFNYKNSISNSYLGNIGLPSKTNIFFNQSDQTNFIFQEVYKDYIIPVSDLTYYYSERPYSSVVYSNGSNEEKSLDFIHTQNVNERLNFGINYRNMSTDGYYLRQLVKHNFFKAWTNYESPYYSFYFNFVSNKNTLFHNGGIVDDSYVSDSVSRANNIVVKLNDAKTELRTRNLNVVQQFHINRKYEVIINDSTQETRYSKLASIGHRIAYENSYRNYYDEVTNYTNAVIGDTILNFYENTFNYANTFDTSNVKYMSNEVFINICNSDERKLKLGAHILAGMNNKKYFYFNKDTLFNYTQDTLFNDLYYGFGFHNNVGEKWKWDLNALIYFRGYSEGDIIFKGLLQRSFESEKGLSSLVLNASFKKQRNDFFLNQYHSNHFKWSNNFLSPETTKLGLSYSNFNLNLKLSLNAAFLDNFIYFDTLATPRQTTSTFDVYSANFQNTFKLWKFRLKNNFVYQSVETDSVLRLPKYTYYGAFYIEDTWFNWKWLAEEFHDVLQIQLGIEMLYNSGYYGYAFMPSIEQFYIQNKRLLGNYPILSAFANFKVSSVRVFVKYEHIDHGLTYKNPFTVLNYPLSESMIKFGLSWNFYN